MKIDRRLGFILLAIYLILAGLAALGVNIPYANIIMGPWRGHHFPDPLNLQKNFRATKAVLVPTGVVVLDTPPGRQDSVTECPTEDALAFHAQHLGQDCNAFLVLDPGIVIV